MRPVQLLVLVVISSATLVGGVGGASQFGCGSDRSPPDAAIDSGRDADTDAAATIGPCMNSSRSRDCRGGWCRIPSGSYAMGSPLTEFGRGGNTEEIIDVTLSRCFIIQQHELTQAQWASLGFENRSGVEDAGAASIGDCIQPDCPASRMTWFEGAEFANALSKKEGLPPCYVLKGCRDMPYVQGGVPGVTHVCDEVEPSAPSVYDCRGYRYPTDAEWEYAARAGTNTPFYSGDITLHSNTTDCIFDPHLDAIGWYCWNSPAQLTHPVEQKAPNAWGLFDMSGNADEFSGDPFFGRYERQPTDPWQKFGPMDDPVTRGGVVYKPHTLCRSAWRSTPTRTFRAWTLGLRLARTLISSEAVDWKPPTMPEPPEPILPSEDAGPSDSGDAGGE